MVNDDSAAADSYYEHSATRPPVTAPLREGIRTDICVIGAGIAGLSTALHLATRGYRVLILEQQRVGDRKSVV